MAWTGPIASLLSLTLSPRSAILDGELVALQPDGVSSFPGLQAALKAGRDAVLTYYAFGLLHLERAAGGGPGVTRALRCVGS